MRSAIAPIRERRPSTAKRRTATARSAARMTATTRATTRARMTAASMTATTRARVGKARMTATTRATTRATKPGAAAGIRQEELVVQPSLRERKAAEERASSPRQEHRQEACGQALLRTLPGIPPRIGRSSSPCRQTVPWLP
eukprot:4905847-Heterocapsa_arctica.AAC.1